MTRKLINLNDHLFAQLERLGGEDLTGDELKKELERTKGMSSLSKDIISNARLALDAKKSMGDFIENDKTLPKMIE